MMHNDSQKRTSSTAKYDDPFVSDKDISSPMMLLKLKSKWNLSDINWVSTLNLGKML